jgi:PKD repeat protein
MKMRPKQIVLLVLLLIVVLFSVAGCFLINTEPTASFTAAPTSGVAPFTVSFDASSSFDPDGHIASYDWVLATEQTQEPKAASGKTLSHTYDTPGTFSITLTVTDDKGKLASVSKTIVVRENLSPTASFSATPTTGEAPLTVAFDASTSADPDGSIISYNWNFGDGASRTGVTSSHTYDTPGTFNITLTVTDNKGKTGFATQTIYVSAPAEEPNPDPEPTPPDNGNAIPTASFTCDVTSGTSPLLVNFEGAGSYDPDGEIVEYHWDFGNGETSTYNYVTSGIALYVTDVARTYVVTLTVTDDDGAQDTATQTIYVSAPDPEPTPSVTFEITDWTQDYYESLQEYGLVHVYYKVTNTGTIDIDYYEVWIEVQCADGSTYQEWTNGLNVAGGTYITDDTFIDTADKRAVSVSITKYELTHD